MITVNTPKRRQREFEARLVVTPLGSLISYPWGDLTSPYTTTVTGVKYVALNTELTFQAQAIDIKSGVSILELKWDMGDGTVYYGSNTGIATSAPTVGAIKHTYRIGVPDIRVHLCIWTTDRPGPTCTSKTLLFP